MQLTLGNKVVYPCQGPCRIGSIVEKVVAGRPMNFYQLIVLDVTGGELFVPVEKVQMTGIRLLLRKSEIPKLLQRLTVTIEITRDWKQRAKDIQILLSSGSAFDLAKVISLLTTLNEKKFLSLRESWTLERARKLLICEISEVMGNTRNATEEQMDQALKARKTESVGERFNVPSEVSAC